MKHICVMGEGNKAHIIAHNAAQGEDVFVSRFSVNAHEAIQLMPLYAVSVWVPRADLYIIVQDMWPSVFYFEDVAEKYGAIQNVMYVVDDDMNVCAEHMRRWNSRPVCAAKVSSGLVAGTISIDVGVPSSHEGAMYTEFAQQVFGKVQRLRVTSLAAMYYAEELDRKMYKTLIQNGPSLVQNSS